MEKKLTEAMKDAVVQTEERIEGAMTPLEAMTLLIQTADQWKTQLPMGLTEEEAKRVGLYSPERVELAQAVATAMLNTALPVARFRAFVAVDFAKTPGSPIREEFTVSAVTMGGIKGGLIGLREHRTQVHLTVWEQRRTGAEMITGYEGPTKGKAYNLFLGSLHRHEAPSQTAQ